MRQAVLALLFALLALPAGAQESDSQSSDTSERITSFDSDIVVARNGTLSVTETIAVYADGEQIRHGIYRDFPTRYVDKHGANVRVRFDVVAVTRDGLSEPYATESISNGVRIRIGDKNTLIASGPHIYTLTYMTARQIGFFERYDELYWNVTGNGWIFPIEKASATIHLPQGARIMQHALYTGAQGSTATNAEAREISDDTIHFATTDPLGPNEGLTVAVGFAKGAVVPPSAADLRHDFIIDNASLIVALFGVFVLAIFYLVTWWHHGRDPKRARSFRSSRRLPVCRRKRCATSTACPMTASPSPRR
jgi:hypothetical protein